MEKQKEGRAVQVRLGWRRQPRLPARLHRRGGLELAAGRPDPARPGARRPQVDGLAGLPRLRRLPGAGRRGVEGLTLTAARRAGRRPASTPAPPSAPAPACARRSPARSTAAGRGRNRWWSSRHSLDRVACTRPLLRTTDRYRRPLSSSDGCRRGTAGTRERHEGIGRCARRTDVPRVWPGELGSAALRAARARRLPTGRAGAGRSRWLPHAGDEAAFVASPSCNGA